MSKPDKRERCRLASGASVHLPHKRTSHKAIFAEFRAGASMQDLAAKYGMDLAEVEAIIRAEGRKRGSHEGSILPSHKQDMLARSAAASVQLQIERGRFEEVTDEPRG